MAFETHILPWIFTLAGGWLLLWGGDRCVDHAVHLARSLRCPKALVGAVVLGFGTSLPELVFSLTAAWHGKPDLAVGNVVGSNIANVGLILGIAALLRPVHVSRILLRTDMPLGAGLSILAALWMTTHTTVGRPTGLFLLAAFVVYLALAIRAARAERTLPEEEAELDVVARSPLRDAGWIAIGLVAVIGGAELFVRGAVGVAELWEVPEDVIALTLVAFGTSLPELATTIQAARQGHSELAVGNVAGSNLFNLLLVLGAAATATELHVSEFMQTRGFPAMAIFAILAFPLLRGAGRDESGAPRLTRGQGIVMLSLYLAYIVFSFASAGEV